MAIIDKPSDYFNTKLYTGTGSSNSVTGVGFQPDFTWVKARGNTTWHYLYDAVRTAGTGKELHSNSTASEGASNSSLYGYLSSFNSDGFSTVIGSNASSDGLNKSGTDFASWNWKANGAGSANTDGTISSTVSANTTSGFSIVKYTGNGSAGATIGHGLGSAPSAIFVKGTSLVSDWSSYHSVLGNTGYMRLNNSNAFATASTYWNNTSPDNDVFTVGTTGNINGSGNTYIAYCFHSVQGYSKFGSYTGNGNADGTFVYTGFKPAFIICKITSGTSNWRMFDNKRLGYNVDNNPLYPNVTNVEGTEDNIDILSNGFKWRTTDGALNGSGSSYIYMAFAKAPLVGSNNVPCTAR